MGKSNETRHQNQERLFTAISIGFFLLLVGTLFIINADLFSSILDFFGDFELVEVPHTNIVLPAPEFPRLHLIVYQAAGQFGIVLAVFQVFILALRFFVPSSWEKRSETVGNFIYWAGASFLIQLFLIETTEWFAFWSTIIIVVGVSMIARAIVTAVARV